jgi:3-keto-5-aminohexanoate cleavage enzyme
MTKTPHEILIEETRKVFDAHNEPADETMDKKLIINACVSGAFVNTSHNPNLPITTKEVGKGVGEAYNAGAAMWHFHPRDPVTETTFLPVEQRLKIHKDWCDAAFAVAPDIITNVGAIYVSPPKLVGPLIEEESIMAETRMAPLIDPFTKLGPNNRYVEIAISLCHTAALGRGGNFLSFNNKAGIVSDAKFLQSKGIRVEFSPFKHSDLQDVIDWVIEPGIAQPPVIIDTLLGIHNSPTPKPAMEAFEMLFSYVRMLPKAQGVLWQSLLGGRYWLPLTIESIILGADIVRVGIEDAVYMYPHRNDLIKSCGKVIETVVGIAKYLGREIATPSEARTILGLPQISK